MTLRSFRNVFQEDFVEGMFPISLSHSVLQSGFSLEQLRSLVDGEMGARDAVIPWAYWDTELYSQGDLLRAHVGWPKWLPIPVAGDHGPSPGFGYWPRGY